MSSAFLSKRKNATRRDSANIEPIVLKKPYFAITPYVGYNPAYGVLIGLGSTMAIYLGDPKTTPVSSVCAAISYTTANQTLINLRSNIVTNNSRFILRGDWRFLVFSQPTYGLGTGIKMHTNRGLVFNDGGETADLPPDAQPLNYNYIRLYETFYFRIRNKWYAGIGYCLDGFTKIVDHDLNLDTVPEQITNHYRYSNEHGFNPEKYTMSGLSLEILLDSRDNSIRPTKGYLANIAFRPNFTFLGSSKTSLMLNSEFRTYISLSKHRPDHLIGFLVPGPVHTERECTLPRVARHPMGHVQPFGQGVCSGQHPGGELHLRGDRVPLPDQPVYRNTGRSSVCKCNNCQFRRQ